MSATGAPPENRIQVSVSITPPVVAAGQPVKVTIELRASDKSLQLEPIAGRRVHLIGVSRDLLWSVDEHPAEIGTDKFSADLTFPSRGEYVLFVLYRPADDVPRVHKTHVNVGRGPAVQTEEPTGEVTKLEPTELHRHASGYTIQLVMEPSPPKADQWTTLTFRLSRNGNPVTDLESLDRLGHLILIREGAEEFVYSHSTEGEALGGVRARLHAKAAPEEIARDAHSLHGPDVTFHARFPKPGMYRVWADFAPGGKRIRADYVIRVN